MDLSDYGCIVIDAGPETMPEVAENAGRLGEFAASGGTVWLHRVRPETADDVSHLCGCEVHLSDVFDLPLVLGEHPLVAGMSEAQVYWSTDPANFRPAKPDMVDHIINVAGGVAVTEPPALVELPHGGGRFLIDQLRWEAEFRNRDRAREFIVGLCANLGIEPAPPERASRGATFVAHFDATAVADYAAGSPQPEADAGVEFVEGRFGGAVAFSAAEDLRYQQRENLDINTGTVEMWYQGSAADDQILFRTTPAEFNDADFVALWTWNGLLRLDHHSMPGGPGSGYIVHGLELSSGRHHIAATWDRASGIALYLDGAMIASEQGTWEATEARFRHFTLSASHRPVTGAIDELRILNYARTPDEIAADASATAPFDTPAAQQADEWVPGMPEPD